MRDGMIDAAKIGARTRASTVVIAIALLAALGATALLFGACRGDQSARTTISAGGSHACALREDGAAICWGSDREGKSSPPIGETFALP